MVKRYRIVIRRKPADWHTVPVEDEHGAWVRHRDHAAEVKRRDDISDNAMEAMERITKRESARKEKAESARDTLREEVRSLTISCHDLGVERDELAHERDQARAELSRAERDRDEARAGRDKNLERAFSEQQIAYKAQEERDEAVRLLRRVRCTPRFPLLREIEPFLARIDKEGEG